MTLRQQIQKLTTANARYLEALKTIAGISSNPQGALAAVATIATKAINNE